MVDETNIGSNPQDIADAYKKQGQIAADVAVKKAEAQAKAAEIGRAHV